MRIWDLSPGYLSRQSLLGEHRELHGLLSILRRRKTGYSMHPETLRWVGCEEALGQRHLQLAFEMQLRGYTDRTPIDCADAGARWPDTFVTDPVDQVALLNNKYAGKALGRIPLPRNAQDLWAQHKYSVMARDVSAYRALGPRVARLRKGASFADLLRDLVLLLRRSAPPGRLASAIEHLWGYVRESAGLEERRCARASPIYMLEIVQRLTVQINQPYLMASTALSDFGYLLAMSGKSDPRENAFR